MAIKHLSIVHCWKAQKTLKGLRHHILMHVFVIFLLKFDNLRSKI